MIGSLTIPDFHIRKNIIVPGCQRLFHAWFPVFVKSLGSVETSCRSREKKKPSGAQGNWSPQLSENVFKRSKWSWTSRGTPLMWCRLIRTIRGVTAIAWLKLMSNMGWLWDNRSNSLVRSSHKTGGHLGRVVRKMISINPGLVTLATHMFCLYVIQDYS